MTRIALFGSGRMARQVLDAAAGREGVRVIGVVSRSDPGWDGGPPWLGELDALAERPQVVIDFSLAGGTRAAARWCEHHHVALLSGTTGLDEEDRAALAACARRAPVLWASNFSRGLNLCLEAVSRTAKAAPRETPVEILDVHHVHKKDAPSGTALSMARAVAEARGQELGEVTRQAGEEGDSGVDSGVRVLFRNPKKHSDPTLDRTPFGSITCVSRREGEVVGHHVVRFQLEDETVEFTHDARERGVFARGALEAALWLVEQGPGMYTARDWLFRHGE